MYFPLSILNSGVFLSRPAIEKSFFLVFVLISVLINVSPDLDLYLGALFYHPESPIHPWFEKDFALWKFFYHAAPVITAFLLLPAISIYILSFVTEAFSKFRKESLYVFLGFLLGPGILINSIFKPYWGRPRPREVLDFGGFEKMQSFWELGIPGNGYSFHCGHSSVGFALILGYFLFKKNRPKIALGFFAASMFFGFLMGIGRMADGAHFFSDVLWSAIMVFLPAYYLHQLLLKKKSKESFKKNIRLAVIQAALLLFVLLGAVLLATPYKQREDFQFREESLSLVVPKGNFIFKESPDLGDLSVQISMKARGFGFPGSVVKLNDLGQEKEFFVEGWFTDFEVVYEVSYSSKLSSFNLNILGNGKVKDQENLPEYIQISKGE